MAIGWIPMPHLRSNLKNFGLTSEIHSALELHCVASALHHTQNQQRHLHKMVVVSGCLIYENERLPFERVILQPCGSKEQAQTNSIEVLKVLSFVEKMKRVGVIGPETKPSEILLFNYDPSSNLRAG